MVATHVAGADVHSKLTVATQNNVRTAGTQRLLERTDLRQLSRAIEKSGYQIDQSGLKTIAASDGLVIPITPNAEHIAKSSGTDAVDRAYIYYRHSTGSGISSYLLVTMAGVDDAGQAYVEFQVPDFGVRFTAVGETFDVTEVTHSSGGVGQNLASRLAGGVTTNAWDFNAIKQCFLSFLGIDNLSQLSGKIDAYCSLNETAKDVLTIATHGSSCVTLGALSCVYFGTYLAYFLTCGAAGVVSCVNGNGGQPGTDVQLIAGQAINDQGLAQGQWRYYWISVPAGATILTVSTSGSGDADLYTLAGAKPTLSTYNCRPYAGGSAETCNHPNPQPGQWWVGVYGYSSANFSITATLSGQSTPGGDQQLSNNHPISGQSVQQGVWRYYYVNVPAGRNQLEVTITGSGDADLYTRFSAKPTTSTYVCRPYIDGSAETCVEPNPSQGQWWIGVRGYSAGTSTYTVVARY
jgi:hypothetical protein